MKLQKSVRLYTDKHFENIGNIFTNLYEDSLLTDCILYCKDGSLKAHKVILAASSRYFRQVFIEHNDDNAIFMYGISYSQLKKLIELIYRGSIDIPNDCFDSVYGLCEELKITGVNIESTETRTNGAGRDTRYRGQKRVAVDYEHNKDNTFVSSTPLKSTAERRSSSSSEKSLSLKESEIEIECENTPGQSDPKPDIENSKEESNYTDQDGLDDQEHTSAWARKERKFKCDICPSSFKRASHLNRHQLVHTGERPFACDQCDKAFSRHDKLKHHIHKTHELGALNEALGPDSLYTIDRVDILTPETNIVEPQKFVTPEPVIPTISSVSSVELPEQPQKKRGRPRKYPPSTKPLVKRPRGRPRIKPDVAPHLNKRPRGRPRVKRIGGSLDRGTYQYLSSDFDSIGYLPKSHPTPSELESSQEMMSDLANNVDMMTHEQGIMEPLVEIKTDNTDTEICAKQEKIQPQTSTNSFFENIGLFENTTTIAKIGECTISVATSCPNISAVNTGGNTNN
ncbi:zinc finger and BTB domain-containing protein 14-like isoform X1 [Diorhabda carinulata]|uniref:zinc finger and BTB domain-containing protein 14-like isoform X1 n=1 Tax=Diorhabda carinulata TaxID=1163345 RepID=UPI0025A20619|nr:zinc finger and BTB domain-containing protein 14-like isoform X1 [Diorhabda carinulata]